MISDQWKYIYADLDDLTHYIIDTHTPTPGVYHELVNEILTP